ncbi:MAG: repeat-containing protein [Actinomycetia bacterium]|nr:repeat-containing protein [Actinomycetes bacterium]
MDASRGRAGTSIWRPLAMASLVLVAIAGPALPARAAGDPPVANNDSYSVKQDNVLTVPASGVLVNDTDTESDPLTAHLVSDVSHGNLSLNTDGSFTYTPAAGFSGSDSFTYKANDGTSDSGAATVSINVAANQSPVVADIVLTTSENTDLNFVLHGSDPDDNASALTFSIAAGVSHGSLSCSGGGSCTYSPTTNYAGSDSFTYQAHDPSNATSNTATASITVAAANHPPVAQAQSVTTPEDTPLGITVKATDVDGDQLAYAVQQQPAKGSVSCGVNTGQCLFTPNLNANGTDSFIFRATDGHGAFDTATVDMSITPVNDAPVAIAASVPTLQGNAATFSVTANDPDNAPAQLTYSATTQPLHGTATCTAAGNCTYTPQPGFVGADAFTFGVHDPSNLSDTAVVTLTVGSNNHAPVAQPQAVNALEGTATPITLTATDVDGDNLTYSVVTQALHGVATCSGAGVCSYTPTTSYNGPDSFTFQATDGVATSNVATVTLTVAHTNQPPVAAPQSVSMLEDKAATITLGATDPDIADVLTYAVDQQALHGTATCVAATGVCTYTPTANYSGADSFTFHANDGLVNSNVAIVSLTVTPVNDPPVVKPFAFNTAFNTPLQVPAPGLLTGATDAEGDVITVIPAQQPVHGTLVLKPNGSFVYDPAPQFKGIDAFTYRAQDSLGAVSAPATVSIGVQVDVGTGPINFVGTNAPEERGFLSSAPRGLHADLRDGADVYDVFFGALRGPVQVDDSGHIGGDRLSTFGNGNGEAISVDGARIRNGSEHIDYSHVETVTVNGQRGNDHVTIGPDPFPGVTHVIVDGGDGDDQLTVNAGHRAAHVLGDSIVVDGWPLITYRGFERVTIASTVTGTRTLSSDGYWLLASDGGVFTFGDAKFYGSTGALNLKAPIIQMIATPSGRGYWLMASDGGVFTFGDARFYGSTGALPLKAPIIQMIATPSGRGYWLLASDGGVFTFGDARFFGSTGALRLRSPVVQMVPTNDGNGYWLRASDGGIFTFGNARFFGSTGSLNLAAPIIQMVPAPSGNGYWLLAANGAVFGFGSAHFHGSTSTQAVPAPPVQLVPTPSGNGYWLAHADGSVFAFGDAAYYGSMLGRHVNANVVQMIATPTGHGYWLLGRDGGIFTFGDAKFHGSTGGLRLRQPIMRMVVRGL